jgi:glycosyltransferase involved in cell wall biosynthesis
VTNSGAPLPPDVDSFPKGGARLRVALVGTRGVPAHYGGFETCVEEVGARLAARGHEVVVYCRKQGDNDKRPALYRGMSLVHLPALRRRSLETLSHTGLSAAHLFRHRTDAAIVFNCANAPFLPVLRARGIPLATHVDGLEWRRAKWGRTGQRYYKLAEKLSVRWSDALIADAIGISDYYRETFGATTDVISYGAPAVGSDAGRLAELDLSSNGYHLVVARFEPENHVLEIVQGYVASAAALPLVVVGSAPYSDEYTRQVREAADGRVRFLGGVWDQDLLDQLYANARTYLHGHSVGGTNPSLLRALGAGAPTNAFNVVFNREVLGEAGRYFTRPEEMASLIDQAEADPAGTSARGSMALARASLYDWDKVTDSYEALCRRLAAAHASCGGRRPAATARAGT